MSATAADVVAEARSWIGAPFHHQGRVRAGVDCVGLVVQVGKALGAFDGAFDYTHYGRHPTGALEAAMRAHFDACDEPIPGGILVVRWHRLAHHLGLFTGSTMIHSYEAARRVVEHRFDARWRQRCMSFYRYRGVRYG